MARVGAKGEDVVQHLHACAIGTEGEAAVEAAFDGGARFRCFCELAVDDGKETLHAGRELEWPRVEGPEFLIREIVLGGGELGPDGGDFDGAVEEAVLGLL